MKKYNKHFILLILVLVLLQQGYAQEGDNNNTQFKPANYEIVLNLNEFSILSGAVTNGLTRYKGNIEIDLNIKNENDQIFWHLSTTNKRVFDVLELYTAQKSIELLKSINIANPAPNDKVALNAVKSLSNKIDFALNNPLWDLQRLIGVIHEVDGHPVFTSEGAVWELGNAIIDWEPDDSDKAFLIGHIKEPGKFEVVNLSTVKENTLELFVMSHCPFGNSAISSVITKLDDINENNKTTLEIRYIFSKKSGGFVSLHGEPEIIENLVQMIIRDNYSNLFVDYLKLRIKDNASEWQQLALNAGITKNEIDAIVELIENERGSLIQHEYQYMIDNFIDIDASPTFIWESEIYQSPNEIAILNGNIELASQQCK